MQINDDQLLLMRLFAHPVYGLGLHVDAEGSLFQVRVITETWILSGTARGMRGCFKAPH